MYNILVTGANGQLGSEIKNLSKNYSDIFFFTDKDNLDITKKDNLETYIYKNNIDVIINCGAYTNVDKAEDERDLAFLINGKAVHNLAEISKEKKIKLVHISTDYVFNGKNHKPYLESDLTNPIGEYGNSKRLGEKAILEISPPNSIIVRTSWLYSSFGKNNFVKTMLRLGKEKESLGVVFDQIGTPTYAKDLAQTILDILPKIENPISELYHYSNEGAISWYDFAKEIIKMAKLKCQINPIESFEFPTKAYRPPYSVLNKRKIKEDFFIKIPYWKDGLKSCLIELGEKR